MATQTTPTTGTQEKTAQAPAAIPESLHAPDNCARFDTPPLAFVLCDDGVPSAGGRSPNNSGASAVTVPAEYGGDGFTGLPERVVPTSVPGADGDGYVALDVNVSLPLIPPGETGTAAAPEITLTASNATFVYGWVQVNAQVENKVEGFDDLSISVYRPDGTLHDSFSYAEQQGFFAPRETGEGDYRIAAAYEYGDGTAEAEITHNIKFATPEFANLSATEDDDAVRVNGMLRGGLAGENITIAIRDPDGQQAKLYSMSFGTRPVFTLFIPSEDAGAIFNQTGNYTFAVTHEQTGVQGNVTLFHDAGETETAAAPVNVSGNAGGSENADIAVQGSDIYVVWQDDTSGRQEIFYSNPASGYRYADDHRKLEGYEEPEGVRVRIVNAHERGWTAIAIHRATGLMCGMTYGLTPPVGWTSGVVTCPLNGAVMPDPLWSGSAGQPPSAHAFAARATSAFRVSTEIGPTPRSTSPATTGTTRAISSFTGTGAAPGRVDSPPMSMISAPLAAIAAPSAMAFAGSSRRPPSKKESGVTLTMPMINVRRANSSLP